MSLDVELRAESLVKPRPPLTRRAPRCQRPGRAQYHDRGSSLAECTVESNLKLNLKLPVPLRLVTAAGPGK